MLRHEYENNCSWYVLLAMALLLTAGLPSFLNDHEVSPLATYIFNSLVFSVFCGVPVSILTRVSLHLQC